MYKVVEIQPYKHTGIDGKTTEQYVNEEVGVGLFKNEEDKSYKLICKISKNVGSIEEQKAYATLITTLLNENRRYVVDRWV